MSKRAEQLALTLYTPWSEDGMSRKDNKESRLASMATSRPKQRPSRGPATGCSRIFQYLWITTMKTSTRTPTDRSLLSYLESKWRKNEDDS